MSQQQQQRYRVVEKIAAGGMAEVFRAESAGLEGFKKTVAIKRVLPHLSEKKQFINMFLDEARISAHLAHSNCVQVFDIGIGDNAFFIVMEYVDGSDLKGVIEYRRKRGLPFPVEEACLICVRICEGLAYAHEAVDSNDEPLHIVHRDMSPPNVLITKHGEVKIVDFGLAKANTQLEKSEAGIIKGKFAYLSPEAARGEDVDARTDIFAVGIILWEMLSGRRLFIGDNDLETVRMVQRAQVPSIRKLNPQVSVELETVLMRSLTSKPEDRYATARDFGRDLNNILYRVGRAVSSFDIAQLVSPVRDERLSERRRKSMDKGSIIGSLIDEALFEFTSIEQEDARARNEARNASARSPANPSSSNVTDWLDELGFGDGALGGRSGAGTGLGSKEFELGNLSALEEDAPRPTASSIQPDSLAHLDGLSHLEDSVPAPPPLPKSLSLETPQRPGGPSPVLIGVVVLVVAALAAAGAWFSGLIPH